MKATKRLTVDALLIAIGLLLFIVEAQIPPLTTIPGIKIGLANVATLFAIYFCGKKDGAFVLLGRVILGAIFSGNMSTFIYSICGGILCYCVMCIASIFLTKIIWPVSVLGAVAHNIGQLIVASVYMHSKAVFWYIPYLLLSAIITGAFTGVCAQLLVKKLSKIRKENGI